MIGVEDDELEGLTDEERAARLRERDGAIGRPIEPTMVPASETHVAPGMPTGTIGGSIQRGQLTSPSPDLTGSAIGQPIQAKYTPQPRPSYEHLETVQAPMSQPSLWRRDPETHQYEKQGIGAKILRPLEVIGSAIAPGPMSRIPGTRLQHQAEIGQAQTAAEEESKQIANREAEQFEHARTGEQEAKAEQERARAEALRHPQAKPTKFTPRVLKGPNGEPMAAGYDPATNKYFNEAGEEIKNPVAWEKEALSRNAKAGVYQGHPAFAIQTEKGWTDVDSGRPMPGFEPQPTFAETGFYERISAIDPTTGQIVPATMDKRTRTIQGFGGQKNLVPIEPEAAKQIGTNLEGAREADTRLETMAQNYKDGLTGNQQAMLSLLANHIGMTLGLQRGARITQAIYNEAMASAPILGRLEAHFDDRGYLSGVVLTPEQMKQMMELADQKRGYLWTQAEQAGRSYGIPLQTQGLRKNIPLGNEPTGRAGAKTHSFTLNGKRYENVPDELYRKYKGKPGFKED